MKMRKLIGLAVVCGILSACGAAGKESAQSGTGSLAFKLELADPGNAKPGETSTSSLQAATLDCAATGIANISVTVKSGLTTLATGGPWDCSLGQGTVGNVKAGSGYTVAISGTDAGGTEVYSGTKTAVTVTAGATANVGTIALASTGFVSVSGTVSDAAGGLKPSTGNAEPKYTPVSGATVRAIGPDGAVAATTATDSSGNYTLKTSTNKTYIIRISYNNVVLKAVAKVGTAPLTSSANRVHVNPTSSAVTMLLAHAIGVTSLGESGTSFSTQINTVDVDTALTELKNNSAVTTVATSIITRVNGNTNPFSDAGLAGTIAPHVSNWTVPQKLPAPTGVTASVGDGQIKLNWTSVAGATGYDVYYRATTGVTVSNGTKVTGVSSGGAVTGLTNGTTYYFIVVAKNSKGEGIASTQVSGRPTAKPASPSGVTVTPGTGQVTISWTAVTGATSYNVYYRTTTGVTTLNGTKVTGHTSGSAITGLTGGSTYYFIVVAQNAAGEGIASAEESTMPELSAPTGVTATAGTGQVSLSWSAVTGAASYNVYYRTTTGVTVTNGTKVTGATSGGAVTGLTNGTTYYFIVTAVSSASGEGAASTQTSAMPQVAAPGAPTGVSASAGNAKVTVSWTAVTGATSYNVYWRTTTGVSKTLYTGKITGASSPYSHTLRTNGTTYYYVVTAVNAGGESAASSQVSAKPIATPTGVSITAGSAQATVSWTAVTGATSYNVYYGTSSTVSKTTGTQLTNSTSPETVTGLTNGTTYYFIVTAVNADGEGDASTAVSATPAVVIVVSNPTPSNGTSVQAGASGQVLRVYAPGATGGTFYYDDDSVLDWSATATVNGNYLEVTVPYAVGKMKNSGTNYWYVNATNSSSSKRYPTSGNLSFMVSATAAPSAPAGVSATAGNAQATVSWNAVTGATSYKVYYGTSATVSKTTGTALANSVSPKTVTGLTNGTTYYFIVTAVNTGGEGDASMAVSATPQVPAPSAPTGVSATAGNAQATVSWNAVTGATSYNLYYGTSAGVSTSSYTTKVTGATSGSAVTGLTNGTTYYFIVTAVNAAGESAASSTVSALSAAPTVPSAPTGVSATAGNAQATVSWSAATGATSYNVYYGTTTGVTTTSYTTKITGATSGSAVTGLTNGTTYYFIVTAVNGGGESVASSQVNAAPSAATQMKVPDTGQTTKYSTAFGDDSDYLINAPSYTDNGNSTITDNVTGLMWQQQDDGITKTWDAAGTYCTDLVLGGYSDWRLPSRMELITIVNLGTIYPSINAMYFPNTQSSTYWSSTTYASSTTFAWYVYFSHGSNYSGYKTNPHYVRCVRGQQAVQSFADNGNGTITDNVTGLMWQKQDDWTARAWEAAITYCEGLTLGGHADWRLPNYNELLSIVDDTVYNPAISATYFPATHSSDYWSSTTDAYNTTLARRVFFYVGYGASEVKTTFNFFYARCVRLGQ